jgi:antitoxin (DNA-binding transcriptional repressor) of toxin-antitoxin stability system
MNTESNRDYLNDLASYTVEDFQNDFDNLMSRVENGEHIMITDGECSAVLVPADDEIVKIYTELNNEAP